MEAVIVALITMVGGVLVALIQKTRNENTRDHAIVAKSLDRIEDKIDHHIVDHATGKFSSKGKEKAT